VLHRLWDLVGGELAAQRLKGAQLRSGSSAVLVQQTAEQVAPTHSALLILGDHGQPGGLI